MSFNIVDNKIEICFDREEDATPENIYNLLFEHFHMEKDGEEVQNIEMKKKILDKIINTAQINVVNTEQQ
jgi:hypothetical protein